MQRTFIAGCLLLLAAGLLWPTIAQAQCEANVLAALKPDPLIPGAATFNASVWTNSAYCPANGHIVLETVPPGAAMFGNYVSSFFDIFLESYTVRPVVTSTYTAGVPFQIIARALFDDPVYGTVTYTEQAWINPGTGRLEFYRPGVIPPETVPVSMSVGQSACFRVIHKVYRIPLNVSAGVGKPIIRVTPGCTGQAPGCPLTPCIPGALDDYRYSVLFIGGQWILEFEYSNPLIEPVCYCVNYAGNEPLNYEVQGLVALNEANQTFDLTLWTNNPAYTACGTLQLFSYPSGVSLGSYAPAFSATSQQSTLHVPMAAGAFGPGQQFQIIAYLDYTPPNPCTDHGRQWLVETALVLPSGGLTVVDRTGLCASGGGDNVPAQLLLGQSACFKVCHRVYYIPLTFAGLGIPQITVTPGCGTGTTCAPNPGCVAGGPADYVYEVFRIGGTWMLRFEYSNVFVEPVCYCVSFQAITPLQVQAYELAALNASSQVLNVSVWSSSSTYPVSGSLNVVSNPPGAAIGSYLSSFFDIYTELSSVQIPVAAGSFSAGQTFQIKSTASFTDPVFPPITYTETVIVTPGGTLERWNPLQPCVGPIVPPVMAPGQSACFKVCHDVYSVVLTTPLGAGQPIIEVSPGCMGPPQDACIPDPACTPGGANDYMSRVYQIGTTWFLEFEYSNPYVQPVCYCVTYSGNLPADCAKHELLALDDDMQTLDLTLWETASGTQTCPPLSGTILDVFSVPAGAAFGAYPAPFVNVGADWYTVRIPVSPGTLPPSSTAQLVTHISYSNPSYPDVWKIEDIRVDRLGGLLQTNDVGGECAANGGDNVPVIMQPGSAACFQVCHKIYHIALPLSVQTPVIHVSPGCFGLPQDQCFTAINCQPGGSNDYRYSLRNTGTSWDFEFEYSNPLVEPVCYCISIDPIVIPCDPVTNLVIQWPDSATDKIRLAWTCPQAGNYQIYTTTTRNNHGDPPGPDWYLKETVTGIAGEEKIWSPDSVQVDLYKSYVIKAHCQ
jgi:hypothetical protein